jgi:hypothetical protein
MVRLIVRKKMHVGPLRRELVPGMVVEYDEGSGVVRIDGQVLHPQSVIDGGDAVRMLIRLAKSKPEDPCIEVVGEVEEPPFTLAEGEAEEEAEEPSNLETVPLLTMPILGCMKAGIEFLEAKGVKSPKWVATNPEQTAFMEGFGDLVEDLAIPEMQSIADTDAKIVNGFLRGLGFDIKVKQVAGDGFMMASVFDLALTWVQKGTPTIVNRGGKHYPAFRVRHGVVVAEDARIHPFPVIRVNTKSGDQVCITPIDKADDDLFLMVAALREVRKMSHAYDGAVIPMIDLDFRPYLGWLNGMKLAEWSVLDAVQQIKFRMNEEGARAAAAAGMAMSRGISLKPYVVEQPFLLWIERDGLGFPLFTAVLCEDCWKGPAEL